MPNKVYFIDDVKLKRGKEVDPPDGFGDVVDLRGKQYKVRYFTWVKAYDTENEKWELCDGWESWRQREIWLAVNGTTKEAMRSTLGHEFVGHQLFWYIRKRGGIDRLPDWLEEIIVQGIEESVDSYFADNPWIRELYD